MLQENILDGQQVLAGARARHLNHELQRSSTFYKMEAEHAAASEERHALKQLEEQQAAALAASESEARGRRDAARQSTRSRRTSVSPGEPGCASGTCA